MPSRSSSDTYASFKLKVQQANTPSDREKLWKEKPAGLTNEQHDEIRQIIKEQDLKWLDEQEKYFNGLLRTNKFEPDQLLEEFNGLRIRIRNELHGDEAFLEDAKKLIRHIEKVKFDLENPIDPGSD